ncbi:MAG: Pilus assembly protein, PilO [Syntrophorhabdus sp. PtaU1.Bin153]|nr:MAG: Pilus assembly protein, PilO [Syntrophorhabdus sp. PtaU1.Bin153]
MKTGINFSGIGKKLPKITKTQRLILVICLNIIVFVLLFIFVINPVIEAKKKLANEYQLVKRDLDEMIRIKNNMDKSRAEYTRTQEALQELLRQLPETKDIPNLLRNMSSVGTETQVKVSYFEPGTVQNKDFYGEFPFKIRYSGTFHNIGYFFDGIRRMERLIEITNFSLVAKGAAPKVTLEGECSAKSYVYLKEQPKTDKDDKKNVKKNKDSTPKK